MHPEKLTRKQLLNEFKILQQRVKQLEAENKKKESSNEMESYLLNTLMENIPDAIYFKDIKSRFIRNSKAHIEKWFKQRDPGNVIGKTDFDFFTYDHAKKAYEDEQNIIQTGKPLEAFEEKETWPDGHVTWVSTSKMPLRDLKGNIIGTFGLSQDVTQRKQAEEKLKHTAKDLEQSNKELTQSNRELEQVREMLTKTNRELQRSNQELEQFAYVASHDLQEPLRMISSYAKLLEKELKDSLDSDSKEFFFYMTNGAQRMQTLINDLLTYSRVTSQAKPFEKMDLNILMNQVLQNLKVTIEEKQAKITHDSLPAVMCDPVQFERLFQNLIGNALKYCENKPEVHISAVQKNGKWLIGIRDNGIGIDPKYNNKIFGIFKRLHHLDEYSGTGIGLAVCKKIVERHGGEIWVESEGEGKGSTFYFTMNEI